MPHHVVDGSGTVSYKDPDPAAVLINKRKLRAEFECNAMRTFLPEQDPQLQLLA
jgi:hypothetical protein